MICLSLSSDEFHSADSCSNPSRALTLTCISLVQPGSAWFSLPSLISDPRLVFVLNLSALKSRKTSNSASVCPMTAHQPGIRLDF